MAGRANQILFDCSWPSQEGGSPCKASSEGDHQDMVPLADPTVAVGFIEGNRDGGGGGVAVAVEIDLEAVHTNAKSLRKRLNNAGVCLVWDDEADVFRPKSRLFQNVNRALAHDANRDFEDLIALHLNFMHGALDLFERMRIGFGLTGHAKDTRFPTIRAEHAV